MEEKEKTHLACTATEREENATKIHGIPMRVTTPLDRDRDTFTLTDSISLSIYLLIIHKDKHSRTSREEKKERTERLSRRLS